MNHPARLLLAALVVVLCSSCDSLLPPKYRISVHCEGAEEDNPREIFPMELNGRKFIFKRVAQFSQRQIVAFEPFAAPDGQGNGVVLQLDVSGRNALEYVTRVQQGELLLTMCNGVPIDLVQTDRPVSDGRFTIWRGISDETIAQMDKKLPRLSQMRSSSRMMDMLASTDKEKSQMRQQAREEEKRLKAQQEGRKSWFWPTPKKPNEIPLE